MADFYTYRNEVAGRRRKRRLFLILIVVLAALCIGERITFAALTGAALILYGMWRAERA